MLLDAAWAKALPGVERLVRKAARAALGARVRAAGRGSEAEILEAQALMTVDPGLLDAARERMAGGAAPDRPSGTRGDSVHPWRSVVAVAAM